MRKAENKELYGTEQAIENTKKLFEYFGIDSVKGFVEKEDEIRRRYNVNIPSLSTMNNFVNKSQVTKRQLSLLIELYNKIFNDSISIEEYIHESLAFRRKSERMDLYTGFYCCYFMNNNVLSEVLIKGGYLNISSSAEGKYDVRAIIRLDTMDEKDYESIKAFLTDPSLNLDDLLTLSKDWNPNNNYYRFFEGNMEITQDYCCIKLMRSKEAFGETSFNEIIIYMRKIARDMRTINYGSLGIMLNKSSGLDFWTKRIVLSKKYIPTTNSKLQELLADKDPSIKDLDDFGWHIYVSNYEGE